MDGRKVEGQMTTTDFGSATDIGGTEVENVASGELGPWRAWAAATGPADLSLIHI